MADDLFVKQCEIVEQEYDELIKEFAAVRADLMRLRFRRAQIRKQVENLKQLGEGNAKRK